MHVKCTILNLDKLQEVDTVVLMSTAAVGAVLRYKKFASSGI
jgi:hypothetical protein